MGPEQQYERTRILFIEWSTSETIFFFLWEKTVTIVKKKPSLTRARTHTVGRILYAVGDN